MSIAICFSSLRARIYTYNQCTIHIQTDRLRSRHTSTMTSARSRDSADVTTLHGRQLRASSNSWANGLGRGGRAREDRAVPSHRRPPPSATPDQGTRTEYHVWPLPFDFRLDVVVDHLPRLLLDMYFPPPCALPSAGYRPAYYYIPASPSGSLASWLGGCLDDPASGPINMHRPQAYHGHSGAKRKTQYAETPAAKQPMAAGRVDKEAGVAPSSRARAVESLPRIASCLVNFVPAPTVPEDLDQTSRTS